MHWYSLIGLRSMTGPLSCFGSFTIDDLVFADGSTRWCVPGGSAPYAALGASLWLDEVSIVAPLGSDYPLEVLQSKVSTSRCRGVSHTLRNWGLYEEDGRRHFVSRSSSRGWVDFCPSVDDVTSGYQAAAHVGPMPHGLAIALVKELRDLGTSLISVDLDDHDELTVNDLDEIINLINRVDLFLPSWQDAVVIAPADEPLGSLQLLRRVAPEPRLIAIKCGAAGVIGHVRGAAEWIHVPAIAVDVVDTTGAGDAFCGGTLAGFLRQQDAEDSLLYGTVSASFCIERSGFDGLLEATEEEVQRRLHELRPIVSHRSTDQFGRNPVSLAVCGTSGVSGMSK